MQNNVWKIGILVLMVVSLLSSCGGNSNSGDSSSSEWPSRNVTFSVPGSAGGGSDLTSRCLTTGWSELWGVNFTVTNFSSTNAAFNNISNQKTDGLNLGLAHSAVMTQYVTGTSTINPIEDLTVISAVGNNGLRAIATNIDAPFNTVEEMIEYARKNPGAIKAGSSPSGTSKFMLGVLEEALGIQFTYVEASMETDRLTNLAGGFINLGSISLSNGLDYEKAGKLKVIATMGADGAVIEDFMSDAPENFKTFQQVGYPDAYSVTQYYVVGPANMDAQLVEEINNSLKGIDKNDSYVSVMKSMGQVPQWHNVEDSQRIFQADLDNMTTVGKALGLYNVQK